MRAASVRVDVLGPLRLQVGGQVVDVPGPKRRALLALLTMADGRAVTVDNLVDSLWPGDLPDSARGTLQSHVSRLRGHLGSAAPRLEGLSGAYRLRLDDSDVTRARRLLAVTASSGDPSEARALLGEARSLWRGDALAEFAEVAPLAAWAVSLGELRRSIEEAEATAALDAGAVHDAVALATALVAADPQSESAVLVLMRALAACGRAADAMRAAHDYRRRLAHETGLDPSPALGQLEQEIAALASARRGRVPRPATGLRGRDSELAALHRLLAHERLVTVVGPGGVGKTRLAVELAAKADEATALLLAPVTDPHAIPHALAAVLDLRAVRGDVLTACAALLGVRPHLLLIDNCEHLLPGVRAVVTALVDACPELTVLATSREPLGLPVEQRLRIAPLPLTRARDLHDLEQSPAVAVFVDRARRVRPGFAPAAGDLGVIDEIVRRLDGLPLAIELAAGLLSSLDLGDLHARLDRSLDLLGDDRLTLRQTLEWSYALLPEHEQRLFRFLGAFPDGFGLATAESVGASLELPVDTAGALAHLVDASMVEVTLGDATRYRMLDTMRSFASDRLAARSEDGPASELFLRWALDLVTWLAETFETRDEQQADRRLRRELGNLRAAWRGCRDHQRLDDAVYMIRKLSAGVGWRDLMEVAAWQRELADDPAIETHPDAALVLGLASSAAWFVGELDRADALARAGLAREGDSASCLGALAMVTLSRGEFADAIELGRKAAGLRPDQNLGIAGLAATYSGDIDQAIALASRLRDIATSPTIEGFSHYVAAEADARAGRLGRAEQGYERAIALTRESGATFLEGIAYVGLMTVRAAAGRVGDALDGYRELIDYWERTGGWVQQWTTLRNLARLLRDLDDDETALFLEAAASAAPDAPATGDESQEVTRLPADEVARLQIEVAAAGRGGVLDIARGAIDRHRAATAVS